jgi:hypothetical protein
LGECPQDEADELASVVLQIGNSGIQVAILGGSPDEGHDQAGAHDGIRLAMYHASRYPSSDLFRHFYFRASPAIAACIAPVLETD